MTIGRLISISIDQLINEITSERDRTRQLNDHMVIVGALIAAGGDSISFLQMLCRVHEYGCQIKPVHHQYLAIPIAGVKHPSEIGGLFFHKTSNRATHPGTPSLAANVNGGLKVYFLLVPSINIPARPFMRPAVRKSLYRINSVVKRDVSDIYDGVKLSYKYIYNEIGKILSRQVKRNIITLATPPDQPITINNKGGRNDPLVDTGAMLNSISWKVV